MRTQYKGFLLLALIFVQNIQVFAQSHGEEHLGANDVFSEEEQEFLEKNAEKHEFQAEVGRLMDIIINSLYTQKEIFIRELISNASDALDKIRFLALSNPEILGDIGLENLAIKIEVDPETKTISIYDSGIGMTKGELINNLGTIAKSGTTNFIEALGKGGNVNLIGQFGVGFYSTFLAGNKVTVTSKSPDDEQYIWESATASSFEINKDPRGNTLGRGTKVTIHLKQDSSEFSEVDKVKTLVKKYSEFINFPIYIWASKEVTKEVPLEEDADETEETEHTEETKGDDLEIKEEDEHKEEKPTTKTVRETVWDWELINENKALWLRSRDEIEDEEYHKFYKAISKDYEDPLAFTHFSAEGEVEFRSILFVPQHAPHDLFDNYQGKSNSLKLYVRRVLINEKFEDLMPRYMNFIKGIVDSDDLPLNVSRESLQQLKMLKVMYRKLVRKALEMIQKLADAEDEEEEEEEEDEETTDVEDDLTEEERARQKEEGKKKRAETYKTFWKEFGKNLKLGIIEDPTNRNKLAQLSRWHSTHTESDLISLDTYIERMKENQDSIYYLAGESKEYLLKAPSLQSLIKHGYEVLLLDDPIDEFCMQHLTEYEKKKLVNVAKEGFKMPTDDESSKKRIKQLKKMYKPLTDWWRSTLNDYLDNVFISQRLVEDPCVVIAGEQGYSARMESISRAQAYASSDKQHPFMNSKRVLEINPAHPIIKELLERVKDGPDDETKELATVLYETALLNSGYALHDAHGFSRRFFKIFNGALGIAKDAPISEPEIEIEEDEEPKSHEHDDDDDDVESHHGHAHGHHDDDEDETDNVRKSNDDL
jgi:heat shock protein beta